MSYPVTFDTYRAIKRLMSEGMPEKQANAVVETMREAGEHDISFLATKMDLKELEAATKADFKEVRTEIAELKAELKADVAEVGADMKALELRLQNQLKDLQIRLGGMIVALGGVLIAVKYFG